MPQYDPQRARSRQRKADDEGPAPVDALLGPGPSSADLPGGGADEERVVEAARRSQRPEATAGATAPPVTPAPVPARRGPSLARPLALAAVITATVVALWWILRLRRGATRDDD